MGVKLELGNLKALFKRLKIHPFHSRAEFRRLGSLHSILSNLEDLSRARTESAEPRSS